MRAYLTIFAIVAFAIVVFAWAGYVRLAFSPWSWSLLHKDTLTGSWYGMVESKENAKGAILLNLHLPHRLRAGVNLQGSARVFTSRGETTYDLTGRFDGSEFNLTLVAGDPRHPSSGGSIEGTWSQDTLSVKANIYTLPTGEHPAFRVTGSGILKKGEEPEYRTLCRQLMPS